MPRLRQKLEGIRREINREWRFILATFAASGTGYLGSVAAPFIVQALIESGLNHRQAGDLGTLELTTLAFGALLMTPLVPYVSRRKLAVGGVLIAALGVVVSALAVAYETMIVGRLVIGAGSALAISGANAAVAAREDAERIFAIIWTMGGGVTAALSANLPRVVHHGNYPGGYWVLLALCLASLPLLRWLPPRPTALELEADAAREGTHTGRLGVYGPMAQLVLLAIFVYSVSEQALWQFSYELGVDAGIPDETVGTIIGFTVIMGLFGGAFAAWLGLRLGRVIPVVAGSLFSLAGRWVFIAADTTGMLWLGGLLWGLGFYFVSPYQVGLAAAIDRRGRVAVATAAFMNFGYGLGPTIAGRIRQYQIDHDLDRSMLIFAIAGLTLLSLLMLLPVALRLDRGLHLPAPPEQAAAD